MFDFNREEKIRDKIVINSNLNMFINKHSPEAMFFDSFTPSGTFRVR